MLLERSISPVEREQDEVMKRKRRKDRKMRMRMHGDEVGVDPRMKVQGNGCVSLDMNITWAGPCVPAIKTKGQSLSIIIVGQPNNS